jgi:methylmalonyl-CoA mutase cobalamin-binding subunit
MDAGHRPGKLMAMPLEALHALAAPAPAAPLDGEAAEFLAVLRAHDAERLQACLTELLMRGGMTRFVMQVMPQLNEAVGDAWMRGQLAIFEEHLYSHHVQSVLRTAISQMRPNGDGLRVLLTSLPDEPHTLGLLMAEALFSIEGADCVSLGSETPAPEVVQAAIAHRVDVVALSFSAAFPAGTMFDALGELRRLLPGHVELWAGGAGAAPPRRLPEGVARTARFDEAVTRLREKLAGVAGHVGG